MVLVLVNSRVYAGYAVIELTAVEELVKVSPRGRQQLQERNEQQEFEGEMSAIGVGLIGWGTVGCGVVEVLRQNAEVIESRLGVRLELKRVADVDLDRPRPVAVPREKLTTRAEDILNDPDIQIVIELMGGLGAARELHHSGSRKQEACGDRQQGAACSRRQ